MKKVSFLKKIALCLLGIIFCIGLVACAPDKDEGNTVRFYGNGETGGQMSEWTLSEGETSALPLNAFTKSGFEFVGWSTTLGGSVVYTDGESYTMGSKDTYALYAVWRDVNEGPIVPAD